MKAKGIILTGVMLISLLSCETENDAQYSVTGTAQKGPYVAGTDMVIYELNDNLGQTGRSFTATIHDDLGNFEMNNIELNSDLVLLTASGFYYSEIYNKLSEGELSLHAVTRLSEEDVVNVNVLTHVIRPRIEKLVSDGVSFQDAVNQSKGEFLTFLGVSEPFEVDFENLDISQQEDYNGLLLAFSIILQRTTDFTNELPSLPAELTQLLSRISNDFKDNGEINTTSTIDTLLHNIAHVTPPQIRESMAEKYNQYGVEISLPDFEKYLKEFQLKHSDEIYADFTYPEYARPEPLVSPDSELPNFLAPDQTQYNASSAYCIAAYVPFDSSLEIKFIKTSGGGFTYSFMGFLHGWKKIDHSDGWSLISQRENNLMTGLFRLEDSGSATIEYYENDSDTPSFSKDIAW